MVIEGIISEVQRLKEETGSTSPAEMCDRLGICLQVFPMGTEEGACKGFCLKRFGVTCIMLNADLSERNQQIILAHELGHACLHEYLSDAADFTDIARNGMNDICEYEANLFAAELLIPDSEVLELLNNGISLCEASEILAVPGELMDYKLRILQKKGYDLQPLLFAQSNFMKGVAG